MTVVNLLRVVSRVLACATVLSMSACCSTHRLVCSPEAAKKDLQLPANVCFNLASVSPIQSTNVISGSMSDFGVVYLSDDEVRAKMMQKAQALYPKLFADVPGAIPLNVTVTRSARADHASPGGMCVSCLTLTLYPMPIDEAVEYTVQVKSTKADLNERLSIPVTFTRFDVGRTSCCPTGYLPVFGGKGDRSWDLEVSQKMCETLMMDSSINAVVTALQRVDPAVLAK